MRDAVFITGGGGFVGRRLLRALSASGQSICALDRSGTVSLNGVPPGVSVIRGDLLQPDTYRRALETCNAVVHLAASTGAASEAEHFAVNARGTELLLHECRRAGVSRIVFVSTIAVGFPDLRRYHYARAKVRAEAAVRESGLRFTIIRPTIILGPGAPIRAALGKLASLPVMVMPGNGRARVQPIHVDDVVRAIRMVLSDDRFDGATYDIGGPTILDIEALVQRLRAARTGRPGRGRVVHVPLSLFTVPLTLLDVLGLAKMVPITVGQLSSFRWDGTVSARELHDRLEPDLASVAEMCVVDSDPGAALDAECRVFTRHLLGCEPDPYIKRKYRDAHAVAPALAASESFDLALVRFARAHPVATSLADAYAAAFARTGLLRAKLVLLLAILETRAPYSVEVDRCVDRPVWFAAGKLVLRAAGGVISLVAGAALLLPARLVFFSREKRIP